MEVQSQVLLDAHDQLLPSNTGTSKRAPGDATHVAERPKKRATRSKKVDSALPDSDGGPSTLNLAGQPAVGQGYVRSQRNKELQVPPAKQLDNLSEILTAKPVRAKSKKQLEVIDSETPNPMAAEFGTGKKRGVGTRGARGASGGRGGRGRAGKQSSVARAPAGLEQPAIDFNALAAAYNSFSNSPVQLSAFNAITQQLLQAYPPDYSTAASGQGLPPQDIQRSGNTAGAIQEDTRPESLSINNFPVNDQVHVPGSLSTSPSYAGYTNSSSQSPGLANSIRASIATIIPDSSQLSPSANLSKQGKAVASNSASSQAPVHPRCGSLFSSLMDPDYSLGISDASVQSPSLPPNMVPPSFDSSSAFATASTLLESAADNVAGVFATRRSGISGGNILPQHPGIEDDSDDSGEGDEGFDKVDEAGHEPEMDTDDNNEDEAGQQNVHAGIGQRSSITSGIPDDSTGRSLGHGYGGQVSSNAHILQYRFESMEREPENDSLAPGTGVTPPLGNTALRFSSQQVLPGLDVGVPSQYQTTQPLQQHLPQMPSTGIGMQQNSVQANGTIQQSSNTYPRTHSSPWPHNTSVQRTTNHASQDRTGAQEIASKQIQLQLEAARHAKSSLSIGGANEQDVLTAFHTNHRQPRAPNPEALAQLDSFVGTSVQERSHTMTGAKTLSAYLEAGGGKRRRPKQANLRTTVLSTSRDSSAAPYSRSQSISAASSTSRFSTLLEDEWREASVPSVSTSTASSSSAGPKKSRKTYKNLSDLPQDWQVIVKVTRDGFHEVLILENGFPLRSQYAKRIETIMLGAIMTFEEEGGVIVDNLLLTHKEDLIDIVWKIVAIVRNDIKSICQNYVVTYEEMMPPPGSTEAEQIAHTIAAVAHLAGAEVLFTGEEDDDDEGHARNWCNKTFKNAVLQCLYIGKNKIATRSPSCEAIFSAEVPKPGMALVATGMVCCFMEWGTGVKLEIPFEHPAFCKIYANMNNNIGELEEDMYQRMKMAETRREWASEGMLKAKGKSTMMTSTIGSRVRRH